jgi:hypothetical protein
MRNLKRPLIHQRMAALSGFLMVPSYDCRVSVATGTSKLQVQSLPLCPESDGQSSKCGLCDGANKDILHRRRTADLFVAGPP